MIQKNNRFGRRAALKAIGGAVGASVVGVGSVTARQDPVVLTTDPPWITAEVNAKRRTVISVELDDEVYDGWPDNPNSYVLEASIGLPNNPDEPTDAFRIGYAGAGAATRDGTAGGYIRRNVGTDGDPDRFDTLEEEVQGLFQATESWDQQSYEFVINWSTPLPEKPRRIGAIQINQVFGSDGGNGVQNENIDPITPSDVLDL